MKRILQIVILGCTLCCSLLWSVNIQAQTPELVPKEYRLKIDNVDVSNAPDIRIRATFLNTASLPVNPEKIGAISIYDEEDLVTSRPKFMALKDSDIPIDLAIVVPISQRFSDVELESMKKSLTNIIEQARDENGSFPGDRVAGFFDDGRAINVAELGKASEVTALLQKTKPHGQPSFLYSSLDKAIEMMVDAADKRPNARRAIILVTDAFDTYTFKKEDVQNEIMDTLAQARSRGISIYVIMFKPFISSLIPLFEGLSRKTGGTYRYAAFADQVATEINTAWGEIYGELLVEFKHSGLHEGQKVVYRMEAIREGGMQVQSERFREVQIEELKFDWKKFWIITGIIVGLLIIALIVFLLVRRHRKKKAEEEAALQEQIIQEKIERGEVCPKCRRTMMPDWKECMFCAREAAEELNKAKAENRAKAIEEAEKKGIKLENRICPKCNRTMMPQWKECLFCKAGIGADGAAGGARKGIGPRADKNKKKDAPEGRICPVCKRPMKPHWTVCLYCEADASNRPATTPPPPRNQPPQQPQARICPDCGRPMKPHWEICLYCEANRSRE